MIALDAGLLALAVNRYAPGHARAAALLESLAEGDTPWALPWSAVHEFLAFVTHRHAVARTLGAEDAWGFIAALSRSPSVRFLGPGPRHAAVAAEVLSLGRSREPLTLDAAFTTAVLLREHGIRELLSTDPGMRRWAFLEVRDPIEGEPWSPTTRPSRRYRTLSPRRSRG